MSALKKGVAFSVGLVTASCSINGAVEKAAGNVTVCCGDHTGLPSHDATRIIQVKLCATCAATAKAAGKTGTDSLGVVPYTSIRKAREVGDGLVLLDDTEIADAKGDATKYLTQCALTPHPAATVYARTAPGEKAYYVTPDPGHETAYDVLRTMIGNHPELAFVGLWTPRSNATQFRVIVRDGALMMTELTREQAIKSAPVVPGAAPAPMLAMAEQVLLLPGVVTDYDTDTYADHYEDRIQALLATKQVVSAGGTTTSTPAPAIPASQAAAMAQLEAMLAAAAPAPKAAPKKRAAKAKVSA